MLRFLFEPCFILKAHNKFINIKGFLEQADYR